METVPTIYSEGPEPSLESSKTSNSSQDGSALTKLLGKDPVLGDVIKILFERLDETNKKLDDIQSQLRRDVDLCRKHVNELQDAVVKVVEEDEAVILETIPAVQAKSEDTGREVSEDCLGLPVILRRILEQCSNKDLINLSRVNKLWNFEARSLLRDRASLTARIYVRPPCRGLASFASDLQRMAVVPFAGISLNMYHYGGRDLDVCEAVSNRPSDARYHVILDRLLWKHLSVQLKGELWELQDCPAFLLVKKILEDYCGVLKELSISDLDSNKAEFVLSTIQDQNFPCLQTVTINFTGSNSPYTQVYAGCTPAFVKAMVTCAPVLEKLHINGRIEFQENVMAGSSAVLFATSGLRPLKEQVCEGLVHALRTESIDVFCDRHAGFNLESLNTFVPLVMQASHTTLKTFRMDLLFAVPLMSYDICLENVIKVSIFMNDTIVGTTEPHISALVKNFDFTRVFPKLEKIIILIREDQGLSSNDMSSFVERANAVVANKALPDGAINVRRLELDCSSEGSAPPLIFLAQMLPHAKILTVKTWYLHPLPFTLVWEHFDCLEELQVEFHGFKAPTTLNLDSVFCEIFPEEVEELIAKDDEYLKAVNIVPVMPSIACMRGLRSFILRYELGFAARKDSTRMFSKVTGLIGFPRCPDLIVTLVTNCSAQTALDHMKPYVNSVVVLPHP